MDRAENTDLVTARYKEFNKVVIIMSCGFIFKTNDEAVLLKKIEFEKQLKAAYLKGSRIILPSEDVVEFDNIKLR